MYIGKKEFAVYRTVIVRKVAEGSEKIIIKARGNNIKMAVNLALWTLRETLLKKYAVIIEDKEINKEGKPAYVSCIELTLSK